MRAKLVLLLLQASILFSGTTGKVGVVAPVQPPPLALCSTVSLAQVQQVAGVRLEAAPPEYSRLASTCDFGSADVAIRISVQHLTEALDLPGEIATLKAAFPGAAVSEVTDLGTRAIALNVPDAGIQLHVLQGDREYLLVSVMGAGNAEHSFAIAARLARALVGKR